MLTFEIPGDPVAKARPRAAMVAGRARLYTPAKTEKYEARVALFAQQAMANESAPVARMKGSLCSKPLWKKANPQSASRSRARSASSKPCAICER